jgi:hypothetical protein
VSSLPRLRFDGAVHVVPAALHGDDPFGEIDVRPFQRTQLSSPQAGVERGRVDWTHRLPRFLRRSVFSGLKRKCLKQVGGLVGRCRTVALPDSVSESQADDRIRLNVVALDRVAEQHAHDLTEGLQRWAQVCGC